LRKRSIMSPEAATRALRTRSSDVAIQTSDLCKEFAGYKAVAGVSLSVKKGSIHGLIGPNGAGKTTCFNLISKFLQPTRGSIVVAGEDVTKLRPYQIARKGLVRSFQISSIFPNMTTLDNVQVALQQRYGMAHKFWLTLGAREAFQQRATELLDEVGLCGLKWTPARELSYGRKRALELATTLALDPTILLLDEPTAGIAHGDLDAIIDLIRKVSPGRTILLVEHNLHLVESLCDRITVLARGEVIAEGSYDEVARDRSVRSAYLGVEHD
jgi:branched-chain amino acid transport system ATP-binding protein